LINYKTTFTYTNGVNFPNTKTVNATGAGTADGTELVKAFGDNIWGITQALLDAAGLTPDSVTEAPGTSQILDAIRKISGSPGEGVIWWKSVDPSVSGDRVLLLNGQGILRTSYPELDAATYVGDPDNATASAFYHANDAAGTVRNIAGSYLILLIAGVMYSEGSILLAVSIRTEQVVMWEVFRILRLKILQDHSI